MYQRTLVFWFLAGLLGAGAALAQDGRNFDARRGLNDNFAVEISPQQQAAERALDRQIQGLSVRYDAATGVARSVRSLTGNLSGPNPGASPGELAIEFARSQQALLGLSDADLRDFVVSDEVFSAASGATHVYLNQTFLGIPVYLGQLQVNVNRDGAVMSLNNAFFPSLATAANSSLPSLAADDAVRTAIAELDVGSGELSIGDASLVWLGIRRGEARLTWNFQLQTTDGNHWYDVTVDAQTGQLWTAVDWVVSEDYRVYERPVESPIHTSPQPPSDARTLAIDPADPVASPLGWIDAGKTIMDGNNVHACLDRNANNGCDTGEPSCGSTLSCDFALDLTVSPTTGSNGAAAVANLFYWNNTIHDVQYQYGFDEAAGNFQEDNFGRGGNGSDSVNADAQDGAGNCNANFGTPSDGNNPRMQMFLCSNASPSRDGDLDAGVIVHEYGHGISNRQVGGPSTVSCLGNAQQAGEGWSDWLGLAYTAEQGDAGTDVRGIGAYLFALGPNGTIRDLPYSTDDAVNNWTYESIRNASIPHGVGSRWAQAIWEVYWALVAVHGFNEDISSFTVNDPAMEGNKRAMFYVNEGLKNTACSPTFVDNRDGIIQAATNSFGGEDVCTLWEAFAAFGLGVDANPGGSNTTNVTNGFALPVECGGTPPPGGCSDLPKGASCTADSQCCSGKCRGRAGDRTCK